MLSERFAEAAESLLGVPFVSHGRDPKVGLDCAGLVICSARMVGLRVPDMPYGLRTHVDLFSQMEELLAGHCEPAETWVRGDILALRYPPMYNHLAVYLGSDRMVHAYDHRAQHRVVLTPMDYALKKRVYSAWRLR